MWDMLNFNFSLEQILSGEILSTREVTSSNEINSCGFRQNE